MAAPAKLLLASSNHGKLAEYQALASASAAARHVELALFPNFASLPAFDESAPTLAENSAGKALHYSRFADEPVLADDSGLVVPVLGGAPGVHSARYAGLGATDGDKIRKLLAEMRYKKSDARAARFVCVIAVARRGRVVAVVSDFASGVLLESPRGTAGFGYDPIFLVPELNKTFAELTREEKNRFSHRGKAFRRLLEALATSPATMRD
ncbi:MAG: RdgB/HAM1 family non-canonical purine NTP pyrophosphatase [Candidatus Acidiferrales bacterium]